MLVRGPSSLLIHTNSLAGHSWCDVLHEALHRLEELVEVAVAMEVDLKGIEARFLAEAQQVASDFGWRAVPNRPLAARRWRVPGHRAELDAEAHAPRDRDAPDLVTRLAQRGLTLDQLSTMM